MGDELTRRRTKNIGQYFADVDCALSTRDGRAYGFYMSRKKMKKAGPAPLIGEVLNPVAYGRPVVYSSELCQEVYGHMRDGLSLTAAAGAMCFSEKHLLGWMEEHAEFADAVHRGRSGRALKFEREFIETDNPVRAAICRFALPKVNPKDWGEYADTEPPPTYQEVEKKVSEHWMERFRPRTILDEIKEREAAQNNAFQTSTAHSPATNEEAASQDEAASTQASSK